MVYLVQRDVTSRPERVQAPGDACDCHAHIFGDPAVFPFAQNRSYTPRQASTKQYEKMLEAIGVTRAVIVQASVYGLDTSCTMAAIEALGKHRARAVVMLDASVSEAELRRLHEGGARGIRFITLAKGGAPLEQLQAVATKIAPFGWHIQMFVPTNVLASLAERIVELPTPVVLDHMAHLTPDAQQSELDTVSRLLDTGKVWVKLISYRVSLEGPPFRDVLQVARSLLARNPDRCVWGSDWPHPDLSKYMPDDGELLDLLADWAPDPALRRKVLTDNPARLYGF